MKEDVVLEHLIRLALRNEFEKGDELPRLVDEEMNVLLSLGLGANACCNGPGLHIRGSRRDG